MLETKKITEKTMTQKCLFSQEKKLFVYKQTWRYHINFCLFKNVDLSNICVLPDSTLEVAIE